MKKILLIDQYNAIGGGQNILIRIAGILSPDYQVSFWGPLNGELHERLKKIRNIEFVKGVAWDKVASKKDFLKNYLQTVYNTVKTVLYFKKNSLRPDILFANAGKIYPQAVILSFILKKPVILVMHLIYNRLMQRFLYFQIKRFKNIHLLFVSNSVAEKFNQINNITFEDVIYKKIFIRENSLSEVESNLIFDVKRYKNLLTSSNKKKKLRQIPLNIAIVGRIHPEKGQDILFNIIDEEDYRFWKFFIIGSYSFGDDKYYNLLKERLSDRVTFYNEVEDVPSILKSLGIHIVVMPSRVPESFGLIAIEAMASSCFTIVSQMGELPFIAEKTGALVFENIYNFSHIMKKVSNFTFFELYEKINEVFSSTQKTYPFRKYQENFLSIIRSFS